MEFWNVQPIRIQVQGGNRVIYNVNGTTFAQKLNEKTRQTFENAWAVGFETRPSSPKHRLLRLIHTLKTSLNIGKKLLQKLTLNWRTIQEEEERH